MRPTTLIVYLDGDGALENLTQGATVFPRGRCRDADACCELAGRQGGAIGRGPLVVPPKAGRALLFGSHRLDGELDWSSAHGACAAGPGGKVVLQRWFRSDIQNPVLHRPDAGHGQ